jgi:hypothetical protein
MFEQLQESWSVDKPKVTRLWVISTLLYVLIVGLNAGVLLMKIKVSGHFPWESLVQVPVWCLLLWRMIPPILEQFQSKNSSQ